MADMRLSSEVKWNRRIRRTSMLRWVLPFRGVAISPFWVHTKTVSTMLTAGRWRRITLGEGPADSLKRGNFHGVPDLVAVEINQGMAAGNRENNFFIFDLLAGRECVSSTSEFKQVSRG